MKKSVHSCCSAVILDSCRCNRMQFNDIAHHAEASTSPVWQLLRRNGLRCLPGTRGKGRCFSLGSDTKAQVTLDISIGVDKPLGLVHENQHRLLHIILGE